MSVHEQLGISPSASELDQFGWTQGPDGGMIPTPKEHDSDVGPDKRSKRRKKVWRYVSITAITSTLIAGGYAAGFGAAEKSVVKVNNFIPVLPDHELTLADIGNDLRESIIEILPGDSHEK